MIKRALMVASVFLALGAFAAPAPAVLAASDPFSGVECSRDRNAESAICSGKVGEDDNPIAGSSGILLKITRIISIIAGAAAIIVVTVGALRYITSEGDAANVKSAKNTVFYALIGIAVIVLAQSLIEFVVSKI